MPNRSAESRSPARIGFYGNFGAGNLGNEATLQVVIERVRRHWPDGDLLCFCTNPADVQTRHKIAAFHSEAIVKDPSPRVPRGRIIRLLRILFRRVPAELLHWGKCLRALSRMDMLIVAGTGIVADYTTGPLGWPYDIFKLSVLAALCRVKLVFLSVGAGPIDHPLSRRLLKTSFALAHHRSYRDEASKRYLQSIGFDVDRDPVCPDLVFDLARIPALADRAGPRPVVGLGIKDFGSGEPAVYSRYLETMAAFVAALQQQGYGVRLLIGDMQYDIPVIEQFIEVLKSRNVPTSEPELLVKPALTVEELQRQLEETDVVISPRFHNLVLALIQNKPIIVLSDHGKLDSLGTDFSLRQYLLPMRALDADILMQTFKQLESDAERLRPQLDAQLERYRKDLDRLYAGLFADENAVDGSARARFGYDKAV